nr:allantoinase PuuE [Poseidonocella sp. HB161398]
MTEMPNRYERNMRGYGANPPDARWPGGAKIAVNFVVNYEEGGENCLLHGDTYSEAFLSEIVGAANWVGQRHWNMESIYEYGARAGFWRLHRIFTRSDVPVTVYGVASAMARSPEQVMAMQEAGWEMASHGLKWIEFKDMPAEDERAQMMEAIRLHAEVTGERPRGWYTGRASMNSVPLAAEEGGFDYIADTYDDDLPYWKRFGERDQLIIPYTLDANDMRFASAQGFNTGEHFFQYLKDAFDGLYAEGVAGKAKMMTVGLHCRLAGRPGRAEAVKRFLAYVQSHDQVWIATRAQIAAHWAAEHPPAEPFRPTELPLDAFVAKFGSIYEHSPWIAERAWGLELGPAHDSLAGMHIALARAFRSASAEERMGVLRAHPDLAGKLAAAKRLTAESTAEQASAGLDALTDAERAAFEELNGAYTSKFGFPFIIAVRDNTKETILAAFRRRLSHDAETEFAEACRQVERIAYLRLSEFFS